jgi:hypothetical protein
MEAKGAMRQPLRIRDEHSRAEIPPDAVQCEAVINVQFLSLEQQSALLLKLAYRHPEMVLPLLSNR